MNRLFFLAISLAACGSTGTRDDGDASKRALEFYRAGELEKAREETGKVLARTPKDTTALRLAGRIELYRNRLKESVELFRRAIAAMDEEARGNPRRAMELREEWHLTVQELAAACYRMDDFAGASQAYAAIGEGMLATKYGALAKQIPYVVRWEDEPAILPFNGRDPLPTVRIRVNGIRGLFVLDTGASELVLDPRYAKKVGARGVGLRTEHYSGPVEEGMVEEVLLGTVTVRNVPVRMRHLSALAGEEIDGLIGANFLLHFSFTLDHRRERLILRRAGAPIDRAGTPLPLLVVGDRFLVVPGKIDGKSCFLFLHSGLAKIPVAPSEGIVWSLSGGEPKNYRIGTLEFGPVALSKPAFDPAPFPTGLDTNFGFTIAAAVGHEALRERTLTFDVGAMTLIVE